MILNYDFLFMQALQHIKSVRNPHSERQEKSDMKWDIVIQQALFDFGGYELENYARVVNDAKKISISCLQAIILKLLDQKEYLIPVINIDNQSGVYFAIKDTCLNSLLLFKEIEESNLWKIKGEEPELIKILMNQYSVTSCKYVYFMFDNAYLQVIGHNDDKSDYGRGYNLYSLKWFFEAYFGKEESQNFVRSVKKYIQDVKDYLGYILVKSLTPDSLINFRRITEYELVKFPYENILQIKSKKFNLIQKEFGKIKDQYIDNKAYLLMLGNKDFAESLITAEWLYDSMKKAQAIDLTIIGTGYFKAVEQLLFELLCLHKNEGRLIKKDSSYKDLPKDLELNDENINARLIDTTIGAMAIFYKKNLDIFRKDLSWNTKKYIREMIFDFKDLRNGYFHKDNIRSWTKIEEIRSAAYHMIFLLLGAKKLDNDNLIHLGLPDSRIYNDYYKLCEYINYHRDALFVLDFGEEKEIMAYGCYDMNSKTIKNKYIEYSGVYFSVLGKNTKPMLFTEQHLPKNIYLGKFVFQGEGEVEIATTKVKKVFENGKFIGESIVEEEFNY